MTGGAETLSGYLRKSVSEAEDGSLAGVRFFLRQVVAVVYDTTAKHQALEVLEALVELGAQRTPPTVEELQDRFGADEGEQLHQAWPVIRVYAQGYQAYRAGRLEDPFSLMESFFEAGAVLLVAGLGKTGHQMLKHAAASSVRRYRQNHESDDELWSDLFLSMLERPIRTAAYEPRGSLRNLAGYVRRAVVSRLHDRPRRDADVAFDDEEPLVQAGEVHSRWRQLEYDTAAGIDLKSGRHPYPDLEGGPDMTEDERKAVVATLMDTDKAWEAAEPIAPERGSTRTDRRYKREGIDVADPEAVRVARAEKSAQQRHKISGYLTGREAAKALKVPESTFRAAVRKAEEEGFRPAFWDGKRKGYDKADLQAVRQHLPSRYRP